MGGRLGYRFQAEKREHGAVQAELDAASEAFRECERRDVKLREDAKHLGAKARKLREKQARDAAKAQARARCPCSAAADLPDSFCLYQAVLRQVLRVCICITGGVRGGGGHPGCEVPMDGTAAGRSAGAREANQCVVRRR